MLATLIVGLGRSGRGLHLPVVRRMHALRAGEGAAAGAAVVAVEPRPVEPPAGALVARSLADARALTRPDRTVAHLCTAPANRPQHLDELGRHGFRRIIVEKPLAVDVDDLARIDELVERWDLRLTVVAPWLASELTTRIAGAVAGGAIGALRAIYVVQRKPRFTRSLAGPGHPSAFDVELPHSVALALALAGRAQLVEATATDLEIEDVVVQRMGGAAVTLLHAGGVRSELRSDICAMVRERRITLEGTRGTLVGHYASSADDDTAMLTATIGLDTSRAVFRDDSLARFLDATYRRYERDELDLGQLGLQREVVRLLDAAKRAAAADGGAVALARTVAAGERRAS